MADPIIRYLKSHPESSSLEIFEESKVNFSYATLKRKIKELVDQNFIVTQGKGKSTKYILSPGYELLIEIDPHEYFQSEPDTRKIKKNFNFDLINEVLISLPILSDDETIHLNQLQKKFKKKISSLTDRQYKKDFEHLAIDLSWKSAQIEGNTYSLLETEQLLLNKRTAAGKTQDEAIMLLNHKIAIDFILENPNYFERVTIARIEYLHSLLTKDLNIDRNIRKRKVNITGTNYVPPDNEHQIIDAINDMCNLINRKVNVFEKALLALVLISYIQPFSDGNKRTARIICNAILMNAGYCPMSFRTVDPIDYKKAMLIFYEQNNISAVKKMFIEQFDFAVDTYF